MEMLGWLFTFCLQNGNPLKSNFVYQNSRSPYRFFKNLLINCPGWEQDGGHSREHVFQTKQLLNKQSCLEIPGSWRKRKKQRYSHFRYIH